MKNYILWFAIIFLLRSTIGFSQSVTATRIPNISAPFIDGVMEDIWKTAGTITFPIDNAHRFTMPDRQGPLADSTTFTVYFLHDDINLYIAIQTPNDKMIESSDYNESSDGLAGMAIQRKNDPAKTYSMFRLLWFQDAGCACTPVDYDNLVGDAEWRSTISGSWNDDNDVDTGYTFEISVPLRDPSTGIKNGLGGWIAGDSIEANIVLIDHDRKPGAPYNDSTVSFMKCWWGRDNAEDFTDPRWIILGKDSIVNPADNRTVTARSIKSADAPVIDGDPSDSIWQQAGYLRFPNSVGRTFIPGSHQSPYNTDDPSSYTIYFLHDSSYLYVGLKSDDRKIEAAGPTRDDDQASDGLTSLVFEDKGGGKDSRYSSYWHKQDFWEAYHPSVPINDCDGEKSDVMAHYQEGPPRYPYMTRNITWGPTITGTWNDNTDRDVGYAFEYKISLDSLGGYSAGDSIPANIVITDHDNNPNGTYNDANTHFRKAWWGFDANEFYSSGGERRTINDDEKRFVILDNGTPYGVNETQRSPEDKAIQFIMNSQLLYTGLLRSFPDEVAAHTYDNAVALISLTATNQTHEAQMLANAFMGLMEEDTDTSGFFYDSYNVIDKSVGQGTSSGTGPNAWAAFALAFYGETYHDAGASAAARKVANWILVRLYDPTDGGVKGGICHPFEEKPEDKHQNDHVFDFVSTEQVIDAWHLFRIVGYDSIARKVESWLMCDGKGWIETDVAVGEDPCRHDKRFSTGVNTECGLDRRLFLDPQSWGSIVANMIGDTTKANNALQAAETHMRITTVVNGTTVSGFGDGCLPEDGIIWYGGTAQMIVAYVYNKDKEKADSFLDEMSKVQNPDGSWHHSSADLNYTASGCNGYSSFHVKKPSLGETAWNYFALRDVHEYSEKRGLPYRWVSNPVDVSDFLIAPREFEIYQNYPNPFNPATVIKYVVPSPGFVSLKVYDVLGRLVKTLVNKAETPGSHEVSFDAAGLASGVYFYRLEAGSYSATKKLLLLK